MEGEFELEIVPKAPGLKCKPGSRLDMDWYGRSPKRTLVIDCIRGKSGASSAECAYSW